MAKKTVENLPNAPRLIAALRNLGYDFNEAVADVIDNSISAGAKKIVVDFKRSNEHFSLVVSDNGLGMTKLELIDAMKLGTEMDYRDDDLGKFGMGLKTASISQCKKFTVVSRSARTSKTFGYQWDLDFVERCKKWEMIELSEREINKDERLFCLTDGPGTVVFWENMDRMDDNLAGYERPGTYVGNTIEKLKLHLRMTFHRFLDSKLGPYKTISIYFNGEKLTPWDPFCRKEDINELGKQEFVLKELNAKTPVIIEPVILPNREDFTSTEAWEEAKGLLSWNDSQGYYIYRANRLIHYGGWLKTRAKDEHTKYARVAISFKPVHDSACRISVNKTSIELPPSLFDHLVSKVNPVVIKAAQIPYRKKDGGDGGSNGRGKKHPEPRPAPQPGKRENPGKKEPYGHDGKDVLKGSLKKLSFKLGTLENGELWKLERKPDNSFIITLDKTHEFYKNYLQFVHDDQIIKFVDSIFYGLAYAELLSIQHNNRDQFDDMRGVISDILKEKMAAG